MRNCFYLWGRLFNIININNMAIRYVIVAKRNPANPKEPVKYHAQAKSRGRSDLP
jgi:hypothetical protein